MVSPLVEQEGNRSSRGTLQRVLEVGLWTWVVLVGHRVGREAGDGGPEGQAETS